MPPTLDKILFNDKKIIFYCFFIYAFIISWEHLLLENIQINLQQILSLAFGISDHILYALISGSLLILLRRFNLPIFFLVLTSLSLGLLLIVDRVFFQIFYQHLSISAIESGTNLSQLLGSFYAELALIDIFNLILLLILQVPIISSLINSKKLRFNKNYLLIFFTSLLFSILFSFFYAINNLHYNPLIRTFIDFVSFSDNIAKPITGKVRPLDEIYQPIYASNSNLSSQSDEERLKEIPQLSSSTSKKNIILLVLESIGSLQLFPNGQFSEELTPFLASIKNKSILFDSLYTYYPATTRSHVPLQTGGVSFTYGLTNQLKYPFIGDNLVSILKSEGYQTSLFSAQKLDFGNLDKFYQQMNFDFYFDPITAGEKFNQENKVHSWGVFESSILPKAFNWIDKTQETSKPFLLQLFTASSHHPYGYPGSKKERKKLPRLKRYIKSLRYTDQIIKEMYNELKKRKLLDNTIIYITGDHGQAFGKRHKKNFTHRNYIYEENIKTFLLKIDNTLNKPEIINRPGSIGDIMPTIVNSVYPGNQLDTLGQNLFNPDYQERLQFFHKHQIPAQWGLLDGKWKYINEQSNIKKAELYNLAIDPEEKNNLVDKYPNRISQYQSRVAQWSSAMQLNFNKYIDAKDLLQLSAKDLSIKGPKRLRLGIKLQNSPFKTIELFHPDEDIVAQVYRIPDGKSYQYHFTWTSPSKKQTHKKVSVKASWERITNDLDSNQPMEEGEWTLNVKTNEAKEFEQKFLVSRNAKLIDPRYRALGPKHISLGYQDQTGTFHQTNKFNPLEQIILNAKGLPYSSNKDIQIIWQSPSKTRYLQAYHLKKSHAKFQLKLDNLFPLESGEWQVQIILKNKLLTKAKFEIQTKHKLVQQRVIDLAQRNKAIKSKELIKKDHKAPINTILIIDENANKAHMQPYGYLRSNMPLLMDTANSASSESLKPDLLLFQSAYSSNTALQSKKLPLLLTQATKTNNNPTLQLLSHWNLIDIFNIAEIPTSWIGSTASSESLKHYKLLSNAQYQLPFKYSHSGKIFNQGQLLKDIYTQLKNQNKTGGLITIHIPRRIPSTSQKNINCQINKPYESKLKEAEMGTNANSNKLKKMVNCHDNHMIQIDQLLVLLQQILKAQESPSMLWYTNNDTPHIFEKVGHLKENLSNQLRDTPLVAWFSKTFSDQYPDKIKQLNNHLNSFYDINNLSHTLLGLNSINSSLYQPEHDLSSTFFTAKQTKLEHLRQDDETLVRYKQKNNIRKIITEKLSSRILPHRLNSIGKLKHILTDGYQAFEMDLMFKSISDKRGYFIVGHDKTTLSGLSLSSYFSFVPDKVNKIWFDIKNINENNINAVIERLKHLEQKFSIKERVIIESNMQSSAYKKLAEAGYYTSYYLPTQKVIKLLNTNNSTKLIQLAELIISQANQQQIKALSFDSKLYPFVKSYIEPKLETQLDYHTWDMSVPFKENDFWNKMARKKYYWDKKVKTILLAYYSEFTL